MKRKLVDEKPGFYKVYEVTDRVIEPDIENLEKELKQFFKDHHPYGVEIESFEVLKEEGNYDIHINSPEIDESLGGGDLPSFEDEIAAIGEKYHIVNLGFPYYYYGK